MAFLGPRARARGDERRGGSARCSRDKQKHSQKAAPKNASKKPPPPPPKKNASIPCQPHRCDGTVATSTRWATGVWLCIGFSSCLTRGVCGVASCAVCCSVVLCCVVSCARTSLFFVCASLKPQAHREGFNSRQRLVLEVAEENQARSRTGFVVPCVIQDVRPSSFLGVTFCRGSHGIHL